MRQDLLNLLSSKFIVESCTVFVKDFGHSEFAQVDIAIKVEEREAEEEKQSLYTFMERLI